MVLSAAQPLMCARGRHTLCGREKEKERERESNYLCVCVCVCVSYTRAFSCTSTDKWTDMYIYRDVDLPSKYTLG